MNFQKLLFLFLLVLFFKLGNAFANHQGGPLYGVTIPVGFNATGKNVKDPNSFSGYRIVASPPLPFGITYSNFVSTYDETTNTHLKGTYTHQILELILLRLPIGSWGFGLSLGGGNVTSSPENSNYVIEKTSSTSYSANIASGAIGPFVLAASYQVIQAKKSNVQLSGTNVGSLDSSMAIQTLGLLFIF